MTLRNTNSYFALNDRLWCKKPSKQTENYSKEIEDIIFNSVARISNFSNFSVSYGYWTKFTNVPNKDDIRLFSVTSQKEQRLGKFLSPFIT